MTRATKAIGAYTDEKLVSVLLANIERQPKLRVPVLYRVLVKVKVKVKAVSLLLKVVYSGCADLYDTANKEMLRSFQERCTPQRGISFFAVDPPQ